MEISSWRFLPGMAVFAGFGDGIDHEDGEQYWEVLDHDRSNADISILKNRGAFLDEHSFKNQIGVIESCSIDDDKMGQAEISFCGDTLSKDPFNSASHRKDVPHLFLWLHSELERFLRINGRG